MTDIADLPAGFTHRGVEYMPHNSLAHHETALQLSSRSLRVGVGLVVMIVGTGLLWDWRATVIGIVALITVLYFIDLLFYLFLSLKAVRNSPEVQVSNAELAEVELENWPTYTILCPLYKEAAVLPQFVQAISRLDYDFNKLQVLLLLEEGDAETIKTAQELWLPPYFEVVIVPESRPKTKPKACNYGLSKATGEYTVIYDAEDAPEPQQLKKAYLAFQKLGEKVVCMQAKLNFYNPKQNLLTRLFTAEYASWFGLTLPGLQSIQAPIPLGGTSNHFKTNILRQLGGWDAFNVTEDADLGMRLTRRGYQTAIVDSLTLEEANSSPKNWFWQRTRWIKGYLQTHIVHTRQPAEYAWRPSHQAGFYAMIGGKVGMLFVNPFMLALVALYFMFRPVLGTAIEEFFPWPVLYMGMLCLLFGNFLYLYYYMIGCAKAGHDELIKYALLVPLYWLAMSLAAYRALYELFVQPHHWRKTQHGLHLASTKTMQAVEVALAGDYQTAEGQA